MIGHDEASHSPVECSEALLRVFEYLDGEMTSDDTRRVREHLNTCADCLRQYDLDQMVKMLVKRSCEPVSAPVTLRATIVRRLTVVTLSEPDGVTTEGDDEA